jgi:dTDP-4-amino-4,6-dideoxygalactose transaminase
MFARHGALTKHEHIIEGINSRLDGLQAAILSIKLNHILGWTEKRIAHAMQYCQLLEDINQVVTPVIRPNSKHTFHLYVIRVKRRKELMDYLNERGVETAVHYPTALHNLKAYQYLGYAPSDFPIANAYQDQILSLPMYPELQKNQLEYVADCIKNFYLNILE